MYNIEKLISHDDRTSTFVQEKRNRKKYRKHRVAIHEKNKIKQNKKEIDLHS